MSFWKLPNILCTASSSSGTETNFGAYRHTVYKTVCVCMCARVCVCMLVYKCVFKPHFHLQV